MSPIPAQSIWPIQTCPPLSTLVHFCLNSPKTTNTHPYTCRHMHTHLLDISIPPRSVRPIQISQPLPIHAETRPQPPTLTLYLQDHAHALATYIFHPRLINLTNPSQYIFVTIAHLCSYFFAPFYYNPYKVKSIDLLLQFSLETFISNVFL